MIESVRLLNNNANPHQNSEEGSCYYNPDRQCLEHFRFPQIFLRRTKKAYISFVTPEILQIAKSVNSSSITYNDIRLQCHCKLRIPCDMRFCRKVFATHLHQSGIAAEIVDALQGRTPSSVFAKHYCRPSIEYRDRVLAALKTLKQKIL